MSEDFYLFLFFWIGFLIFRTEWFTNRFRGGKKNAEGEGGEALGLHTMLRLRDDFGHRRYEKVLEGWAGLEQHTAQALSLVVTSLIALGRPDDIGVFVAKTSASLPHLRQDLHEVVTAVATPACQVRQTHILCALRDLAENAREALDTAAVKQLLLAFAKFNDEARVADLLVDLADNGAPAEAEFLGKVVRSFLASQNLDAALGYLQQVKSAPHDLIIDVIKASTEAELGDDSGDVRPKAWDTLDTLKDVKLTNEAALLFLEWSARQTPVDVAMATRIEELLRAAGPLPVDACDALVRVHASSAGDKAKAFAVFDEMAGVGQASEASLVGMISSCMEARNCDLAEHMLNSACAEEQCTLPVFSATLKVLAASKEAERVCAIYEKVSSNKKLVLDETLVGQIAECATQAGHTELARSLTKSTKKQSGQSPISQMRACAQEGDVEQLLTLLKELQEEGEVDTMTYNCALDICVSAQDGGAAKTVLKQMKDSGKVDVASYNISLKQCLSEGASTKAAQEVIMEMHYRGLEPNTATYNSLLSVAMTTGDFTGVWQTIDDLQKSGQSADIYTLSILFKGYRRERRPMDVQSIDRALMLVKKHGVKIDESLVNVALEACLALRDQRCLKRALDTFWESGWSIPKQAAMHTYGVLIKSYGQLQSLTEAWQLWTEVTEEKGMEPSEQLYGQMLDVLVANDCLEDAQTLFRKMKTTHKANLNTQGFAVAYAMIIRGFAQQKDLPRALECYEEMKGHGTKASLVVLNTLIDACSRVGDMHAATGVFQDMTKSECVPDLITYSTMIKGYCISNDLEEALHLFGAMQEKGIRPDAIVFNSLLDGCAKKQVPALCEQVLKDMEGAGVVPSNHSASIMIKLYGRCKDLDAAFRVINEMPQQYGFRANNAVYTCLMSACIANNQLEKAMELRIRMVEDRAYPDDRTYSTLLRGALRACSVEKCVLLVDAAIDQGNGRRLLDEDLVRSVLILAQRNNEWDTQGRELQNRLRTVGINVRLPMPSDSCSRNDGFGQGPRENVGKGKGKGDLNKDGRFQQQYHQQQSQNQYQQQRRY